MSIERSSSVADGDVPSWASPLHQGREDGSKSSQRRRSLECTSATISIPQTEYIRNGSASGHQVYVMQVSSGQKTWQVRRRYSDFHYLDTQLRKFMLKRDMPIFPPKRFIGSSTDRKFVEERRLELERYITALVGCPTAWNASDFVRFIDNEERTMMMLWNLEKMRRVQDTLSTMTLDNRSETNKLSAELMHANQQVAALQERIARMEMIFLQQITGVGASSATAQTLLRNMCLAADGADQAEDSNSSNHARSPAGAAGINSGAKSDSHAAYVGVVNSDAADEIVQDAIGCWSGSESRSRSRPSSSPRMSAGQVKQVLDMTAAAVSEGRMSSLSSSSNHRGASGNTISSSNNSRDKDRDSISSLVDDNGRQLTRKSFPKSASTGLQNNSVSVDEVRAMAVSLQLQEAVEMSNGVLEGERFDLVQSSSASSTPRARAGTGAEAGVSTGSDFPKTAEVQATEPAPGAGACAGVSAVVSSPLRNVTSDVGVDADVHCSEQLTSYIDQVVYALLPTRRDMDVRENVLMYIRGVVSSTLQGAECFAIGSHVSNTYLPNGDIDITIVLANDGSVAAQNAAACVGAGAVAGAAAVAADLGDPWFVRLNEALCMTSMGKSLPQAAANTGIATNATAPATVTATAVAAVHPKMVVSNVSFVNAEVKVVKSQINGVSVDITSNRIAAMYAQALVELLDELVGKNHLLKRSLLLVKAWIINEAPRHSAGGGSIAGAQNGGMKSWCIAVMTIWIFNNFGTTIHSPIHALAQFLRYYSTFSWTKYAVTVSGPVLAEGLSPLADDDPNKPTLPGLFSEEVLHDFQRRYEHARTCSESAASGDIKTVPYAAFVSAITPNPTPTDVSGPVTTAAAVAVGEGAAGTGVAATTSDDGAGNGGTEIDSCDCAAADAHVSSTAAIPIHPAKAARVLLPTPWLAAPAFGGDSAENYRRGIVNVVDPIQAKNNLSKAMTIASFHTMVAVFERGYAALCELFEHSNAAAAGSSSSAGSLEAMAKQFMLNTTTQLSELGRGRSHGSGAGGLPPLDFYNTVLSSKAAEVERGLRHAEFVLGSVVHYDQFMNLVCLLLEQRGAPLPVGEIGKLLQERLGSAAISHRIKLVCGGLKKAIELHGAHLVGISPDHPYNPTLYLLGTQGQGQSYGTSGSGSVGSISGSWGSGNSSRSGSDMGSGSASASGSFGSQPGSGGGFLPLSRGNSFKEHQGHSVGGAMSKKHSQHQQHHQQQHQQHHNYAVNNAGAFAYQSQQQSGYPLQGQGPSVRSRGNSNLGVVDQQQASYAYSTSPNGGGFVRYSNSSHAAADQHMHPHQPYQQHYQQQYQHQYQQQHNQQPMYIQQQSEGVGQGQVYLQQQSIPQGLATSPPRSHMQQQHYPRSPKRNAAAPPGAGPSINPN